MQFESLLEAISNEPPQPDRKDWRFIDDLKQSLWGKLSAAGKRESRADELDLSEGVRLEYCVPDPDGLLDTAYADLRFFLSQLGIPADGGIPVTFNLATDLPQESYRLSVEENRVTLTGSDIEGVRRGVYYLEDSILRGDHRFLKRGTVERNAVVQTRISRCFFGPTRRPPHNWDELLDEIDYYPDNYLNKLAYEAVNGLWLTIHLDEICSTKVLPVINNDIERRLTKLRSVVAKCARYGIKIYLFCNEPRPIHKTHPWAQKHPELMGAPLFDGRRNHFCTTSDLAQNYLEDAFFCLFRDVPGLGGLINITVGEGLSHCVSDVLEKKKGCPRCSKLSHHEVLRRTLAAMERGMHRAAPRAELISWPYFQFDIWGEKETSASAWEQPKGIILQHNFESAGVVEQCGRFHRIRDYWLAWAGPAQVFVECAKAAQATGIRMGAKLQVGCSHEVATVPYVPSPGILYEKYRAIHQLGVSCVMQCWYFGNYPGVMTKAAGELSFAPLPETEEEFLLHLAEPRWGAESPLMAEAWDCFKAGYTCFPMNHVFGWFGPLHDAVVWPLHLIPVDLGISQSWLIEGPSGDRFAEPFAYTHTLEEVLGLTRQMADHWRRGVQIIAPLLSRYSPDDPRASEIRVALALGIQIESAANMLEFYSLREELPYAEQVEQLAKLDRMEEIVRREIEQGAILSDFCDADPRLGYHSEAEGYKYFAGKIRWRMGLLNALLEEPFATLRTEVKAGVTLWGAYTGREPVGPRYVCGSGDVALDQAQFYHFEDATWRTEKLENTPRTTWSASRDGQTLRIKVVCMLPRGEVISGDDTVRIKIEPRRMWPVLRYEISKSGRKLHSRYPAPDPEDWSVETTTLDDRWIVQLTLSAISESFWPERPVRINLERRLQQDDGIQVQSWVALHPLPQRLVFGDHNPADLGWLFREPLQQ